MTAIIIACVLAVLSAPAIIWWHDRRKRGGEYVELQPKVKGEK